MVTKEKLEGLGKMREELETCPHCGARLDSRHARRQHLTLRVCQGGLRELEDQGGREQIVNRSEPRERTANDAGPPKRP